MPTIEVFAKAMGYRSTSSAHNALTGLVQSGYLVREERGGRLMPGPLFARPTNLQAIPAPAAQIPPEILKSLPAGVELTVLEVPVTSLREHAICVGDMLVLVPLERTDLSDQILQRRGISLALSIERKPGWRAMGLLVAQFRRYGRPSAERH